MIGKTGTTTSEIYTHTELTQPLPECEHVSASHWGMFPNPSKSTPLEDSPVTDDIETVRAEMDDEIITPTNQVESHITAARSFLVLGDTENAESHLLEAMGQLHCPEARLCDAEARLIPELPESWRIKNLFQEYGNFSAWYCVLEKGYLDSTTVFVGYGHTPREAVSAALAKIRA